MGDVLIRGLSEAAVARIDADAATRGLSRQEYLRCRFVAEGKSIAAPPKRPPTSTTAIAWMPRGGDQLAHRQIGLHPAVERS